MTDDRRLAVYSAQYFQMETAGDLNLENLRASRFFEADDRGIIQMIEYWPAARSRRVSADGHRAATRAYERRVRAE